MIDRLSKFFALDQCHKGVVLRALVELPFVAIFVSYFAVEWLNGEACVPFGEDENSFSPVSSAEAASAIAHLVNGVVAVLPIHARCLVRSVYLCRLLRKHNIACRLVVGARKDEFGRLAAHAWVESGGVPINDALDIAQRFFPLTMHGAAAPPHVTFT